MADKENVKSETISVVVRDQTGAEVHFKVKEHTRFNKVFDAYCKKKSMPANSVRFMFDGNRIQPDNTPAELNMEDGDVIDAVMEQIGGRRGPSPL